MVSSTCRLIPGVGNIFDLLNANWYKSQCETGSAAMSAAAAVPIVGWGAGASKVAKWGAKGAKAGEEGGEAAAKAARFGKAVRKDYRKTFFEEYPDLEGHVVVHHSVEQKAMRRYPNAGITEQEMYSLENLRGIQNQANSELH